MWILLDYWLALFVFLIYSKTILLTSMEYYVNIFTVVFGMKTYFQLFW